MSQKRTAIATVALSSALMLGVFQNCAEGNSISANDQKASTSLNPPAISNPGNFQTNASCPSTSAGACTLPSTVSGSLAGSCTSGNSGSCSYQCSDGIWGIVKNTCAPASCPATTINSCVLAATSSGASSGSCPVGDKGNCSATCTNGAWTVTTNSCTPKVLTCTFSQPNVYYFDSGNAGPPVTSQQASPDGCLSFCAASNATLCQYYSVNGVYYCQAYSADQYAQMAPQDFVGIEASGFCSLQ